jgi:iron complex transport system substrate-binding protein
MDQVTTSALPGVEIAARTEMPSRANPRRRLPRAVIAVATALLFAACSGPSTEVESGSAGAGNPVTIDVCGTDVTFEGVPERVFVNDINMLEMMLALELEDHIAAAFLWGEDDTLLPELSARLDAAGIVPTIGSINDEVETILAFDPDMVYAGWNYGLRVGGAVTPELLAERGVNTYLLRESCRHVQPELGRTTMDDIYYDARALGQIFGVEDRAEALIAEWQSTIREAAALVPESFEGRVDIFLYDSGEDEPFTAGFFAIPDEMFRLAGGRNIVDDVNATWTAVSWERVIEQDPEFIPVVEYGGVTCDERIATLQSLPALRDVTAIVNANFDCYVYAEVVPGVRTADATLRLAQSLWN